MTDATPDIHLTDLGNALRLQQLCVNEVGQIVYYAPEARQWLTYRGTHWALDDGARVEQAWTEVIVPKLHAEADVRMREASQIQDEDARKAAKAEAGRFAAWAMACESDVRIKAAVRRFRALHGVATRLERFDRDPYLFNCLNGTVNLRTGELLEHDQAGMITFLAPVEYDARADQSLWLRFLEEVQPDPERRAYLKRIAGLCLSGVVHRRFFVVHGPSASGKSTFVEALAAALGPYARAIDPKVFVGAGPSASDIGYHLAQLRGARLITSTETEEGAALRAALVKAMTGGDRITGRHPYGRPFEFSPQFKPMIATNHRPVVKGADAATFARLRLVSFDQAIPPERQDADMIERLKAPLARRAILAWAVEGHLEYFRGGLRTPESVMQATDAYREEQDVVGRWIEDRCTLHPQVKAPFMDLYDDFRKWSEAHGLQVASSTTFGRRLEERGIRVHRTMQCRFRLGIELGKHDYGRPDVDGPLPSVEEVQGELDCPPEFEF